MTPKKLTKSELANLSREQKLEMIDAAEELERRKKLKRKTYEPNEGQKLVHSCDKAERYVFSGNGAGKTALLVQEALWAAEGYNPVLDKYTKVPAKIIFVLDDPEKLELKFIPEFKKWRVFEDWQFDKGGKPYISRINFRNGSFIKFLFHGMEPMKFESIELDFFGADEPPPYFIWSALTRGQRELGSDPRTLIVGTPIAVPWLRKQVYEPWARGELPELECFRFDSDVNKGNINWKKQLDYFNRLGEKERRIRRTGEFFDLEGLALADNFSRSTHVIPTPRWPSHWPCILAVDPHPRKSHVALLLGVTDKNQFVALKEMTSRSVPSQFARELKEFYAGYRVVDMVCDSLGSGELTGGEGNESFIGVLKKNGVRIRATRFEEKRDEAWVQLVQEVLAIPLEPDQMGKQEPQLKITNNCKGLIADIETVEWQQYKNLDEYKPKLAIEAKDFLACLKYALAARPTFSKHNRKVITQPGPVGYGLSRHKAFNRT